MTKKLKKDISAALNKTNIINNKPYSYFYDTISKTIKFLDPVEEDLIKIIELENLWIFLDTMETLNIINIIDGL